MRKIYILLLFAILSLSECVAQNIDSLLNVLKISKEDTNQVNTYNYLSRELLQMGEYDTARYYAQNAKKLALKINFKKGLGYSLTNIASSYRYQGNYPEALSNQLAALKIHEEIGNIYGKASSYMQIGNIYFNKGEYSKSLKYQLAALKIREETKDVKQIAALHNNIGLIYENLGNYSESLTYYNLSLKTRLEIDDKLGIATTYGNIGNLHYRQENYSEALKYQLKSLEIRKEIKDKRGISMVYNNIGSIYYDQAMLLGNANLIKRNELFDQVLENYLAALKIREEMGDKEGIAISYLNIGLLYMKQNKMDLARKFLNDGLKISIEIGDKPSINVNYIHLSQLDSLTGNYKGAYINYRNSILYKDSLFNEENTKKAVEAQMQYEFDKKEALLKAEQDKKDALAKEEKQQQKIVLFSTVIGFVMMLFFAVFMYNRFKITQKQNKIIESQKIEVEKQREITENQKQLVEYKNHEITQSIQYAQKIQTALLPSENNFKNIFTDSFVFFKPKDIVSGDFYWLSDREDFIFYATADSTGHGVPGGFMSMLGTALLNEIIDERKIENCGEVLTLMREKIMQALKQTGDSESKDGMDMVLIRINKNTLEMQYAAANNSLYIVSNKQSAIGNDYCLLQTANCQLYELPCDKMPVGVYHSEVKPFQTFNFQLQKGDTIYTYTDGYADQFGGEKGKKYTYKRLREKLLAISQEPLEEQKISLENDFEIWKGENEQIDDVCLIGVRV